MVRPCHWNLTDQIIHYNDPFWPDHLYVLGGTRWKHTFEYKEDKVQSYENFWRGPGEIVLISKGDLPRWNRSFEYKEDKVKSYEKSKREQVKS